MKGRAGASRFLEGSRAPRLALLALAVAVLACGGEETPEPTPTPPAASDTAGETPGTAPRIAERSPSVTGRQTGPVLSAPSTTVRAAMLSIYFHARYENGDWLPQELQPMPLGKAASIVASDRSPFATSRKRRAMARLYVAPRTPQRLAAHNELGTPLATLDARLPAMASMDPTAPDFEAGARATIQLVVSLLERLVAPAPEECVRTFPTTKVDFSWTDWKNEAVYTISVKRGLVELGPVLDPQNWAVCAPKYWATSYVATELPGTGLIDPITEVPHRHPDPPTPGSQWSGMLYEHVVNDWGLMSASFGVLLDVTSNPTASKHVFGYGLKKSIKTTIGPLENASGIVVDEGIVIAAPSPSDPTQTEIEGSKVLKFANFGTLQDFGINFWTSIALEQMGDEAYEAICCQP